MAASASVWGRNALWMVMFMHVTLGGCSRGCFSISDRSGHLTSKTRGDAVDRTRWVVAVRTGGHPHELREPRAEGAERREAHRETDLSDGEVAAAQQHH